MKGGLVWRWQTQKLLYWPAAADALKIKTQLWGKPWMNYCTFSTQFISFFFFYSQFLKIVNIMTLFLCTMCITIELWSSIEKVERKALFVVVVFFFFILFLLILFLFFIVIHNNSFWLQLLLWNLGNKPPTPPHVGLQEPAALWKLLRRFMAKESLRTESWLQSQINKNK